MVGPHVNNVFIRWVRLVYRREPRVMQIPGIVYSYVRYDHHLLIVDWDDRLYLSPADFYDT